MYERELDLLDSSIDFSDVPDEYRYLVRSLIILHSLKIDELSEGNFFGNVCKFLIENLEVACEKGGVKFEDQEVSLVDSRLKFEKDLEFLYPKDVRWLLDSNLVKVQRDDLKFPISKEVSFASMFMRQMVFALLKNPSYERKNEILSNIVSHYLISSKLDGSRVVILDIINGFFHDSNFRKKYKKVYEYINQAGNLDESPNNLMDYLEERNLDFTRIFVLLESLRAGLDEDDYAFLGVLLGHFMLDYDSQVKLLNQRVDMGGLPEYFLSSYGFEDAQIANELFKKELSIYQDLIGHRNIIFSKLPNGLVKKYRKRRK